MVRLANVHHILYLLLAVVALWFARRDREHRVLATYVGWMAAIDVVRPLLRPWYAAGVEELHGLQRLTFHVDKALVFSWTFLFVAVCLHYFVRRGARLVVAMWLVASVAAGLAYPALSGARLVLAITVVGYCGLLASVATVAWGMFRRPDLQVRPAHMILFFYVATDVSTFVLPFAKALKDWQLVRISNMVLLSACLLAHLWWLFGRRLSRPAAA